jgi:hypothetical protein
MVLTTLIVLGLVVGLRLLYRSRMMVAAAGIAIIVATQVLVSVGGQSSPLVLANLAGYVWTFAPAAIAAFTLAWPDLSGLRARAAAASARAGTEAMGSAAASSPEPERSGAPGRRE